MQRMERTNLIMVVLTVLMYSLSTVHIALFLSVDFSVFFDKNAVSGEDSDPRVWMQVVLELVNVSNVYMTVGSVNCA